MDVEAKVLDLIRRTACELPSDILEALQAAKQQENEVPAQLT